MALNRSGEIRRSILVYSISAETRALSCVTSAETVPCGWVKVFTALSMSLNDPGRTPNIDLGVTNKFLWVNEFANTKSTKNSDWQNLRKNVKYLNIWDILNELLHKMRTNTQCVKMQSKWMLKWKWSAALPFFSKEDSKGVQFVEGSFLLVDLGCIFLAIQELIVMCKFQNSSLMNNWEKKMHLYFCTFIFFQVSLKQRGCILFIHVNVSFMKLYLEINKWFSKLKNPHCKGNWTLIIFVIF